jgi:hypothetical protein
MALYEFAVMGAPSAAQIAELEKHLSEVIAPFRLRLGHDVAWSICPTDFKIDQKTSAAVAFFGGIGVSGAGMDAVLRRGVPVLPIASTEAKYWQRDPGSVKSGELPNLCGPRSNKNRRSSS